MALLVSVLYFVGCNVSQYHYNLLCLMLYMSTITHLCAAAMVRTYFNEMLGFLRIAFVILQFVFTGFLFQNRNTAEFATMDSRDHQIFNTSLPKPAACSSRGNAFGIVSTIIGTNRTIIDIGSTILGADNITIFTTNTTFEINLTMFRSDTTNIATRNILEMDEANWYTLLMGLFPASLFLAFGHAMHCYLCKRREHKTAYTYSLHSRWHQSHSRWHQFCLWSRTMVLVAASTLHFVVASTLHFRAWFVATKLRSWMNGSGIFEGGPEDQVWNYGQFVSVFLLASVVFTIIQAVFGW
jgi:hypothetical protein